MAGYRPNRAQPQSARRRAYIRSCLPACCTFLVFSTLLSSLGLLSHFHSPAAKQRIGWQSWDTVIKEHAEGEGGEGEGGLTLPLDVWDPLLPHSTGLTEITVSSCYLSPALFPSMCLPPSTSEDDKLKGKWVRVDKDLNIRTGIWYLSLYYRRTHRLDAPVITDLRIAPYPVPTDLAAELEGWVTAKGDLRSGVWPQQDSLRLYYKLSGTPIGMDDRKRQRQEDAITELDVVFGDDNPFYGFERVVGGPVVAAEGDRWETVDVAYKRGTYETPKAPKPVFHEDGSFKIMQIADLHYSVGKGECRDTDLEPCDGDNETAKWLAAALDEEKPDMVVFSGDQLNGQKTSYDSRSVLAKFAGPVIDRQIPWAAIFGNHDSEINEDREYQMHTLSKMPYSLARPGPKEVNGFGNYLVKIRSSDETHTHLFTLYFLDSGSYMGRTLPWEEHKYDYLKQSQIDWYRNASSHISAISRPFRPASSGWTPWHRASSITQKRRSDPRQSTLQAKPNAIMWFHIPLPEAYDDADIDEDGRELDVGEVFDIGSGASPTNSHMLDEGILQQNAMSPDTGEEGEEVPEVKVLAHGHCHLTERCRRVKGVWMCFDGGSSYSGYGKADFDRRVRTYQLSEYGEKVETYKRLVTGEEIDRQVLVGA